MTPQKKAKNILAGRMTAQLIADFELTNEQIGTVELYIVRGWIMDELESRNPSAFEAWIDSATDSPKEFYAI